MAYIDEAGDPGIARVQPIDPNGASEWFVMAAVVVRAETDQNTVQWVKDTRVELRLDQGPQLHFKNLTASKKFAVSMRLSEYPCRIFVVASHKPNMQAYINKRAGIRRSQNWFYNWCARILLERVTKYCLNRAVAECGSPRLIRLDWSRAGGLSYDQLIAYHEYLRRQPKPYLSKGQIAWDTLHPDLYNVLRSKDHAGVQIADIAASAFYQAVHTNSSGWNPDFARALKSRMGRSGASIANNGLVLMPFKSHERRLDERQRVIFEHMGFGFD